ncbi:fungal-specific transcription factor domain-containing protein, partial [Mycena rebaudengoi]
MPKGQETIRGRYTSKACNICRARKSKCDGVKPSCGACTAYGRGDECSWGRDSLYRKPRTEAHFEALRSRADALQAYVSVLEGMLAKCVCQDVSAHHQVRPPLEPEVEVVGKDALPLDSDDEAPTPGDTITQELCLPMQFLKLDDKLGLLRYGVALPLRFAGRPSNELLQSQNIADSNATYVLMVDGVDETACDLNFDWSRHLPPGIPLDRKEHDKILDLFFKFYSMSNFRVMPFLFLRDMHRALSVPVSQRPPKTPNYSPMLHNAILALASAFSDDPRIQDTRTKRSFMVAARDRLESECQKPDVSLVHSLGFMGTFHAEQGTPILGDCHHGMSARVSQALGLGLDVSEWVKSGIITSDEMRGRNYTHWTLFTWDVYWALCFGREPPSLSEKYNTPMPFVSSESDQILWHHPPANIPPQPNYITLIFSASTSLSLIARKIVLALYGLGYWDSPRREYVYDDKIMSQIDVELNSWKSQLPPEIDITSANRGTSTPQKLMLHCSYWWYFIVLHRPFLNRRTRSGKVSDQEIDHIKLCRRSAENTLELLETWS